MAIKIVTHMVLPPDEQAIHFDDLDDELLIGLRLANWAYHAVNRPPLSELPVPDRHHFPRSLKPKGGR